VSQFALLICVMLGLCKEGTRAGCTPCGDTACDLNCLHNVTCYHDHLLLCKPVANYYIYTADTPIMLLMQTD